MLKQRIIPCLDVRDGRVVKGIKFQNIRDAGDPVELAAVYEAQGADELVILDISATSEGRSAHLDTIQQVREVLSIPLTVGGGVRSIDDAGVLLQAGADKVSLNTAAVQDPSRIEGVASRFGVQCTVVAIDAIAASDGAGWTVVTCSGSQRSGLCVKAWAREAEQRGAGEILLTSWDRDGTRTGYDLELLRAVRDVIDLPIIASGGAASAEHLLEAMEAGVDAVLAASIFHDGQYTVESVKRELESSHVEFRQ